VWDIGVAEQTKVDRLTYVQWQLTFTARFQSIECAKQLLFIAQF